MKKPELKDFGINQEDTLLEANYQKNRDAGPGCIAQTIGLGIWMIFFAGSAKLLPPLNLSTKIPMAAIALIILAWSVGSFFLIILIFNRCYDAIWKRQIPATNPSILKYNEALAGYNKWVQSEEKKKKEYWFSLPGYLFEKEFGKILENNGYSITITPGSADGGVDIVAEKGNVSKIIQCKAHKNPIGPGPIRELFGVLSSGDFKAKSATVVCLGGFTKGAREFAYKNNIELWDVADILKLASKTDGTQPSA